MALIKDFAANYPYDDEYVECIKFKRGRRLPVSMLVIHYAVFRSLRGLVNYFHDTIWTKDGRKASTHYCVGQDGTVVGMVPFQDTAWTVGNGTKKRRLQGVSYANMQGGWWYDHMGKVSNLVNDMSINFETALYPQDPVPDTIYTAIAERCKYHLETERYTRVWKICGHEHMCPDRKVDPGIQWDWEKFFVKYLGVKSDFFNTYLKYLDETKHLSTRNSNEKRIICLDAAHKMHTDLKDKSSAFALE